MLVVYQVAPGQVGLGQTRHKWHGVPSIDPSGEVGLGTLHISFGAMSDPRSDLLADGTRIGNKPGLESCVVS